jgi:polyphosphate kinase 2 (PPK2 family)
MPKTGHIAIFDRSWYGRVLVERVEGLCSREEWKRSFKEINEMEENLANAGTVIRKFWLEIDKEEQLRRFEERQSDPLKAWKITEDDWRNRKKWDEYSEAVDEMLFRTSTSFAPWVIIESVDKYYARIKVLDETIKAIESKL